jgi:hypothetical protein
MGHNGEKDSDNRNMCNVGPWTYVKKRLIIAEAKWFNTFCALFGTEQFLIEK